MTRTRSRTIVNWTLTLKQFLALPEAKPALETGPCGEVTQKVSPTSDHAVVAREFIWQLELHSRPRRLGATFVEQRVILGGLTKVPDVSFYRRERLPLDSRGQYIDHPLTPPDLVVEVYSPGQESRRDLRDKARWYVEQGVALVLLPDPRRRVIGAVTTDGETSYAGDDPLPLEAVLPGLRLTPAEIFAALTPDL